MVLFSQMLIDLHLRRFREMDTNTSARCCHGSLIRIFCRQLRNLLPVYFCHCCLNCANWWLCISYSQFYKIVQCSWKWYRQLLNNCVNYWKIYSEFTLMPPATFVFTMTSVKCQPQRKLSLHSWYEQLTLCLLSKAVHITAGCCFDASPSLETP